MKFLLIGLRFPLTLVLGFGLPGCEVSNQIPVESKPNQLAEKFEEETELIIATQNAPTTYFRDQAGVSSGFEFELASDFARSIGKKPSFRVYDSIDDILIGLKKGHVHFAAAGLSVTPIRSESLSFADSYLTVDVYAVCHKTEQIRLLSDLIGKRVVVTGNTSYESLLLSAQKKLRGLSWETLKSVSTDVILTQTNDHEFDCTLVDSNIYLLNRPMLDNLRVGLTVGSSELAWPVGSEYHFLAASISNWLKQPSTLELLQTLHEKYYGTSTHHDPYDLNVFRKRVKSRLPKYLSYIREASEKSGLSIPLLAAVSYQESHWNPKSVSPTGVRGFMMLTQPTAKSLGVSNRLDVRQSMLGGAEYLKRMIEKFPSFISRYDRVLLGLASYNVGYYHVRDARQLTIKLGKNPNAWRDVKEALPLLSNKKYYSKLEFGYARGHEPVTYVRNIRQYQSLLDRLDIDFEGTTH